MGLGLRLSKSQNSGKSVPQPLALTQEEPTDVLPDSFTFVKDLQCGISTDLFATAQRDQHIFSTVLNTK